VSGPVSTAKPTLSFNSGPTALRLVLPLVLVVP
jgi:hypothetical protein